MTTEKIYYGLMILAIAVSVLASPFFYARSLRFLNRRRQDKQFQEHLAAEKFKAEKDTSEHSERPAQKHESE